MDINWLKILFFILCFQFLFVSFFLFQNKKGKPISNKLLGIVFLMISIAVINLYLVVFKVQITFPKLIFIDDTFMLAYGPLLYLFTQSILIKNYHLRRKNIVHFTPFLIAVCLVAITVLLVDTETFYQSLDQIQNQDIPIYFRIGELIILTHVFYYLFKSKRVIKSVLIKSKELYSAYNHREFKLLKFIINSFVILFSLSLIHAALAFMGIKNGLIITLLSLILFMFYFINSILLKLLNESSEESGAISQDHFKRKEKYAGSNLSYTDLKALKNKLSGHMKDQQRYLFSELSLSNLSDELEVSAKILSQVINEGYSCNFFDFVNGFRIEEAKLIFTNQSDENMTIQEVMYDSGFNSKSTFNTAFKKVTRQTPTQFKNEVQKGTTS